MKKINILIILPSLAGGGAEKVMLILAKALENKKFSVKILILNKVGPLKIDIKNENIIDLKSKKLRYSIPKLIKEIRQHNPDIIFSTFPHITLPLLLLRRLFFKEIKIIAREPNMVSPSLDHSPYSIIIKILHRLLMPRVDKLIVTSKAMENEFLFRGLKNEKLHLIYNPIDYNNLRNIKIIKRFKGEGSRFVIVGRLTYQKGIDRLIPILKNLESFHLTIIGEGPDKNKLQELILKLNLNDHIKFIGFSEDAKAYIAGADYLILPSRWEGLPNVALEALILGTPVISFTDVVSLLDFINLVPKGSIKICDNSSDMEKILNLVSSRSDYLYPKLRANLLKTYNTPVSYAKEMDKIFRELMYDK